MNEKIIILYSRLSSDDGFQANDESNSIANQKKLLDNYVKRHSDLSAFKTKHLWDDGFSGTNFNRPGVTELLNMVKQDKVYCIIVKDFSRFGRNYIEVGKYLEEIFPILGVRFISANDDFDSDYKNATGSIDVGFKNLIHSHYPQETSRKVSQAKMLRVKNGMFVGSFSFFGYVKSLEDKHKIIIDEPAAEIVRYIFKLRLNGMSITEIARQLNGEKIMTPIERKRQLGSNLYGKDAPSYWTSSNVSGVLYDERYTGKQVYLKSKRKSDITFERKIVPRNEWLVMDGNFDPIISREDFDEVCSMRRNVKKRSETAKEKFFGNLIKCGYCGKTLAMHNNSSRSYYCSKRRFLPDAECKDINIPEEKIKNAVLKLIQMQADILFEYKERKMGENSSETKKLKLQVSNLQRIIDKRDSDVFVYYEQYKNGSISKNEFVSIKEKADTEAANAEKELLILNEQLQNIKNTEYILSNDEFVHFEKSKNIVNLNNELIETLIDRIDVYDNDRIEIKWKYQDSTGRKITNE